ncbi:MAG: hypothetical protein A2030_03640 [Chloroflexi bacterium RBG_19FT_COMBO_50_10]|nr:MAG: hypothetical protein A2030_03640 [Chloroflexi bacterium RBG_19FT_COMBO_50_10]
MFKLRGFRIVLLAFVLLLIATMLLVAGLNKRVTLVVDGQTTTHTTYALTVGGLLDKLNIPLAPEDELQPGVETWLHAGTVITLQHAVPVQIFADDVLYQLFSAERLPASLLATAGVTLFPGDQLLSEGLLTPADIPLNENVQAISLQVLRSFPFTLKENIQVQALTSNMVALGQALWKTGIVIQTADLLQPPLDAPLFSGLEASLERAQTLTIRTAAGDVTLLTTAKTVGEALAEAGLALQGLDYSNPPAEQPIPTDRSIRLVRVQEQVIIENTPLPFETAFEPAPELELDSQSIIQTGEYGLTAHRVRVRHEDGQEISRQVEDEWVARQPKPRIVGYGTNVVKRSVDTSDGTIYYYRALTMWITSYSPASVGGSTTTASGKTLRKGLVGVNYHYIPFGTMMYVPGYGYAEAADTGNIGPRWIDLGYTDEEYVAWHQYSTVYFLWPPPAQILWIYP